MMASAPRTMREGGRREKVLSGRGKRSTTRHADIAAGNLPQVAATHTQVIGRLDDVTTTHLPALPTSTRQNHTPHHATQRTWTNTRRTWSIHSSRNPQDTCQGNKTALGTWRHMADRHLSQAQPPYVHVTAHQVHS